MPSGLGREEGQQAEALHTYSTHTHTQALHATVGVIATLAQGCTRETATGDPVYGRNRKATKSRERTIAGMSWLIFAYPCVEPRVMSTLPKLAEWHE